MHSMAASIIIPDRGEFIDALRVLRKGRVLVRVSDISGGCVLDGAPLYSAHRTLIDYGLIREFHNPQGFGSVRYYRLSERGRDFAIFGINTDYNLARKFLASLTHKFRIANCH